MLITGILCLYLPPKIALGALSATTFWQKGTGPDFGSPDAAIVLMMLLLLSIIVVASLVLWVRIEWLAKKMLPSGTDLIQISDYEDWQEAGLRFIGGWLALKACLGFQQTLIGNSVYIADSHLALFYLIASIFLIVGWSNIKKPFSRNWRAV
ncbi:hypothetical protein [Asticcacaulis sp.]|uniref:hypothetical protein n=1 Tax=Asticcacaulis sp. TaxID=1872648 RepID=UPI003F7B67DA